MQITRVAGEWFAWLALLVAIHEPQSSCPFTECKSCTATGKNLNSVIPAKNFETHKPFVDPNQGKQTDFAGPINNVNENEIYILTCIDRFSNYQFAEIFDNAHDSNVINFLDIILKNFRELQVLLCQNSPKLLSHR